MAEPVTVMSPPFNFPNSRANSRDILKDLVRIQYLVISACRLYGQESTETFPQSWVIALDQLSREGKPCNWSNILAHQLKEQVTKARQSPNGMHENIYMSTYILDAICAQHEFPGLDWTWSPTETVVNMYFKLFSECNYKGVVIWLSNHFVTPMYKLIFKQDPPCMSKEVMKELLGIADWYASPSGTFI